MSHEGLVADMRYNGGGHTSQLIIERLSRTIIGWDVVRHGAPEPYPSAGRRGPVVFVTNQFAGSDGDIVCAAAQELKLGPVVGQRSWGGVIGIDGRFDLVDGTGVTQPRYSFHFDTHGWDVENHGIDPDIEYVMTPGDWADEDSHDPQLDLAIAEALKLLETQPASAPPKLPAPRSRR
jgi:tricorn protease